MKGLVIVTIIFAIFCLTAPFIYFFAVTDGLYQYSETTTYTVKAGDTLWEIAGKFSGNSLDKREVIDEIEKLSNCGSEIYPGQILVIPLYDSIAG